MGRYLFAFPQGIEAYTTPLKQKNAVFEQQRQASLLRQKHYSSLA